MGTTQPQIDALRGQMNIVQDDFHAAQLELNKLQGMIGGLTACDPPATDNPKGTMVEYNGCFGAQWSPPVSAFKVVRVSHGGVDDPEPRPLWAWDGQPFGPNVSYRVSAVPSPLAQPQEVCGAADWSPSSREYQRITKGDFHGERWVWLDGYGTADGSQFYPVETTRADWVNLDTGEVVDITPTWAAPQGQPYIPFLVKSSGHWRIRIWGWIWNSMTAGRSGLFYWEGDFTYNRPWANIAWKGSPPLARDAFEVREGWWSGGHTGGEGSGRSTMTSPYDANDDPIVPVTNYLGFDVLARGAGALWRGDYPPNVAGLESVA